MKTKITTIASALVVGLLILPSVTFASWWNPFTWFQKPISVPATQSQSQTTANTPTTNTTSSAVIDYSHGMGGSSTSAAQTTSMNTSVQTSPASSGSALVLDSKPYVDTKNGFSITPPKGWTMQSNSLTPSIISFVNPLNKNDKVGVDWGTFDPKQGSAEDVASSTVALFKKLASTGFNLTENRSVDLNGVHAYLISFSLGTSNPNDVVQRMTSVIIINGGKIYHAASLTNDANWSTEKSVIEQSLLSFKLN